MAEEQQSNTGLVKHIRAAVDAETFDLGGLNEAQVGVGGWVDGWVGGLGDRRGRQGMG